MPELIAKAAYRYGTRDMVAGDRFEAEAGHAKLLVGLGRAVPAPSAVAPTQPPEDEIAAPLVVAEPGADDPLKRGKYKRRDMRAAG